MNSIDIYRGNEKYFTIYPDDNSTQVKKIMAENMLSLSFVLNYHAPFAINDWCKVFEDYYYINALPTQTKKSGILHEYNLVMQGEEYNVAKALFLFNNQTDFSFTGTARDFMLMLMQNLHRTSNEWTLGEVINTEPKTITFNKENCYNVLGRLAAEFSTEFWIKGKTINLAKKVNDTGLVFKVGENKGLYDITRTNVDSGTVVTRVYPFGSDKNLPANYRNYSTRLRIGVPASATMVSDVTWIVLGKEITFNWAAPSGGGLLTVAIEWRPVNSTGKWKAEIGSAVSPRKITVPSLPVTVRFRTIRQKNFVFVQDVSEEVIVSGNQSAPQLTNPTLAFLEKNTTQYGVIESTQVFDDIYPHRTGKVTAANNVSPFVFVDSGIDFNINEWLMPGATPKVVFNTGALAGYSFDIAKYDHNTKTITINKNKEERNLEVPSETLRPAIGDEYVIIDIIMPTSYILKAEEELKKAAEAYLNEVSTPQVSYSVAIDPAYIKRNNRELKLSDLVWIEDDQLGIQRKIRITQLTRNIVEEYRYQVQLSDVLPVGTIDRIQTAQINTDRAVTNLNQSLTNNSIFNNRVIGTLKFESLPTTSTTEGFSQLLINNDTGELYRKV